MSDDAVSDTPVQRGLLAVIGWAIWLGVSWTWVIGMLWPILLLRDHGVAGWVAFALPNVIGAAAMGTLLPNAAASRRLTDRHGPALAAFSDITILFHAFAVTWLVTRAFGLPAAGLAASATLAVWAVARLGSAAGRLAAAVVFLVSVGAFVTLVQTLPGPETWRATEEPSVPLLWLMPSLAFGFLLCPYLDPTFHRARQATAPTTGRWAFVIGFGVVFLSMIVLSLFYARTLAPAFTADFNGPLAVTTISLIALVLHLTFQVSLTTGLHLSERTGGLATPGRPLTWAMIPAGIGLGMLAPAIEVPAGMAGGEAIYRSLLLLYGLPLPGYVWVVMIAGGPTGPTRRSVTTWAVASALAYPLGLWAFVGGQALALIPAAIIMVLAGGVGAMDRRSDPTVV